ncbi:M20/M25/M40 family metallo-hydrolase [Sandaracinus amylolyticus]|uniref:M20/M25/M40 family metallo-hydrolase n=1 Tax=Sandaracinus amylolyticus TaxID=927083 RepID=UPI001F2EC590|nr:M20/M25/M40 family metallo-hydrolase [Sandaracinus amylolyticus]
MTAPMDSDTVRRAVRDQMPRLVDELMTLTRIPSISGEGADPKPLFEAHDYVVKLLREAGLTDIQDLRIPGKVAPVIIARTHAAESRPTVLLYTHYDVVPAGDLDLWETPPFEPTRRNGAIYGRGISDSKANILATIGALRVFDGAPPVSVTIVFEGQEEVGSPFDFYPPEAPEIFRSDAMIIADNGSVRPGVPALTISLRGSAAVTVSARTLAADKHSGQYGGAAPDARIALVHALASLHDEKGDVAVPGLLRTPWRGMDYREHEFRELGEVVPGAPLQGTGTIGERIWSGPAITITGFDSPPVSAPINAVASSARASLNIRVHPDQDAAEAQAAVIAHLRAQRPFGIELEVSAAGENGNGFSMSAGGRAHQLMLRALREAWGADPVDVAGGGSIPIVMSLARAVPDAEMLLMGATDGHSNIHGPNERVLLDELEKATIAKAEFFRTYGA